MGNYMPLMNFLSTFLEKELITKYVLIQYFLPTTLDVNNVDLKNRWLLYALRLPTRGQNVPNAMRGAKYIIVALNVPFVLD
jgi:hypothetical protein